jgi:hypothetical protein
MIECGGWLTEDELEVFEIDRRSLRVNKLLNKWGSCLRVARCPRRLGLCGLKVGVSMNWIVSCCDVGGGKGRGKKGAVANF